ncbi:MAG: hypothetical protein L0216_06645 [Planctomycetales bacterium]|nr:hypothetical protein [Planctomycetales bacterium]
MTRTCIALALCLVASDGLAVLGTEVLEVGKPKVIDTGPQQQLEVTLRAAATSVTRVIITPEGDAGPPTVVATADRKPIDAVLGTFKSSAAISWPNVAARTCQLSLRGGKANDRYRLKLVGQKIADLPPSTFKYVAFPVAISPVTWFRVPVAKGKTCRVRVQAEEARLDAVAWLVLAADGSTIRARGNGSKVEWTSPDAEVCVVRVGTSVDWKGWPLVQAEIVGERAPELPMALGIMDAAEDVEPGKSIEREVKVEAQFPTSIAISAQAGRSYVAEVAGTGVKDTALEVRDEASYRLLDWNDDASSGTAPRLTVKPEKDAGLVWMVRSLDPYNEGKVKLKIRCE